MVSKKLPKENCQKRSGAVQPAILLVVSVVGALETQIHGDELPAHHPDIKSLFPEHVGRRGEAEVRKKLVSHDVLAVVVPPFLVALLGALDAHPRQYLLRTHLTHGVGHDLPNQGVDSVTLNSRRARREDRVNHRICVGAPEQLENAGQGDFQLRASPHDERNEDMNFERLVGGNAQFQGGGGPPFSGTAAADFVDETPFGLSLGLETKVLVDSQLLLAQQHLFVAVDDEVPVEGRKEMG